MNARTALAAIGLAAVLVGCASNNAIGPVGPDHPANPDAAEAPISAASQTLARGAEVSMPAPQNTTTSRPHAADEMGGMQGMDHPADHARHGTSAPADATDGPGTTGATDGPATSPATRPSAQVLYTCRMHPEVVSDKPGKCPKCGMKLVRKTQE